jgi:hypothetical protein
MWQKLIIQQFDVGLLNFDADFLLAASEPNSKIKIGKYKRTRKSKQVELPYTRSNKKIVSGYHIYLKAV